MEVTVHRREELLNFVLPPENRFYFIVPHSILNKDMSSARASNCYCGFFPILSVAYKTTFLFWTFFINQFQHRRFTYTLVAAAKPSMNKHETTNDGRSIFPNDFRLQTVRVVYWGYSTLTVPTDRELIGRQKHISSSTVYSTP